MNRRSLILPLPFLLVYVITSLNTARSADDTEALRLQTNVAAKLPSLPMANWPGRRSTISPGSKSGVRPSHGSTLLAMGCLAGI